MLMDFNLLRKKHPEFIYHGFETAHEGENLKVYFDFELAPDIKFRPEITFPNVPARVIWEGKIDNLIFNLGMVEMLSYWKAACPPKITIKAGFLDKDQIKFWKNLLVLGLGEFFYTNQIDFTGGGSATKKNLVEIKIDSKRKFVPFDSKLIDRDLVLVGGGKDSAVSLDIWAKSGKEFNCLTLNPTEAALKICQLGGCNKPIVISRNLDPKLLELNKLGYLNGHTPFSAYLAFLATLAGSLYDYKNIVVSNEASSNEANVLWLGQEINHQYSKTAGFEKGFQEYCQKYLSKNSNYFSFLRSLPELQIAKLFAEMPKYHKLFRSCNRGSKTNSWCGVCPKCVSTYLTLYPFLGDKTKEIFGKDLLADESLIPVVRSLLRENNAVKPFECVATVEEIKESISLGVDRAKKDNTKTPIVLASVKEQNLHDLKKKSILILGFGREGQATLKFLSKRFPDKNFAIADEKPFRSEQLGNLQFKIEAEYYGKNYLEGIKDYQVIIKSPGIPYSKQLAEAKNNGKIITSATQIFFDLCLGKIIGVTGTKGKSTTASLIYEVLKRMRLNVHLIGNIGKPALDFLQEDSKDAIFVYELSSFQLEDLNISPQIGVITNLYPEHLDHHGDFLSYQQAKNNITNFQTKNDFLIYNQDIPDLNIMAQKSQAQKIPFGKKDINMVENLIHKDMIPLMGEFNLLNIIPAILIGRLFKIPDKKIEAAIMDFVPLPHRLELVTEVEGIRFYNDSLSTIPQATMEALSALGENVQTLIAGGYDRGLDYSILGEAIANSRIKNLILFPDTGKKIWQAVEKSVKGEVKKFDVDNIKDAVELAFKNTEPGKIVLLSPASTSFNLFRDYEDRGNQFKDFVKKLASH